MHHESYQWNTVLSPKWREYCEETHAAARDAFLWWVQNGRPRGGPIHMSMQQTRALFKQSLRHCRQVTSQTHADSLAKKLLTNNSKKFWTEIKKICGKSTNPVASTIGSASGSKDITEMWKTHYSTLLNSSSNDGTEKVKSLMNQCNIDENLFTVDEVSKAIKDLKLNKSCGIDTLAAEHFRYASENIYVLLQLCFNSMLIHGHVPRIFCNTILVPIIKDKKGSITDANNYRPIALTTIASKIFEKALLLRARQYLFTTDNQFSFKSKYSTDMCVFVLKSITDYYKSCSSPIYLCYMDASKAFDRVNFWILFEKLLSRQVPKLYVRVLMAFYCTQEFLVRWGNVLSTPFNVSNGVRQGSVLSPLLFNLYLDDLSCDLNQMNAGCLINNVTVNHLIYADDLVLIAPSAHALQHLIYKCENYASNNNIVYNDTKTVCMRILPKTMKLHDDVIMKLNGKNIEYVTDHKYLGVFMSTDCKDDLSIRNQRRNLYSRGNMLIRNFKRCNESVKCLLFKSFCSNLYSAALWNSYKQKNLDQLKVAYNRVFRILMSLQGRVSMSAVFVNYSLDPFKVLIRKSIRSLRERIVNSENILIQAIVRSNYFSFSTLHMKWTRNLFALRDTG